MLKTLVTSQVDQINLYAYKRLPLMKAFRRQLDEDLPTGSSGLSLDAVKAFSGDLYELDDRIILHAVTICGFSKVWKRSVNKDRNSFLCFV
jgi:hypothetical protein